MYAAGFKQRVVWVPREDPDVPARMSRDTFMRRLDKIMADWSKAKQAQTFVDVLTIIEAIKEAERK
jgi:hypothetical protein